MMTPSSGPSGVVLQTEMLEHVKKSCICTAASPIKDPAHDVHRGNKFFPTDCEVWNHYLICHGMLLFFGNKNNMIRYVSDLAMQWGVHDWRYLYLSWNIVSRVTDAISTCVALCGNLLALSYLLPVCIVPSSYISDREAWWKQNRRCVCHTNFLTQC